MNEIIRVTQLPIIEEHLRTLSAEIDEKVNLAVSLVCTEDTVKEVKKVRSELTKQFAELEEQRKAVKKAVIEPYNNFQTVYDEFIGNKYKTADSALKAKIGEVEGELKNKKETAVKEYFDEYKKAVDVDWLTFDMAGLNITLTVSEKKLKEHAKDFVDRVAADVAAIAMQDDNAEIMVEYRKTRNLSQSLQIVKDRKEQMERMAQAEAARKSAAIEREERAAEVQRVVEISAPKAELSAPKVEKKEEQKKVQMYTATFKVKGTLEQLKELKAFLEERGIKYEC